MELHAIPLLVKVSPPIKRVRLCPGRLWFSLTPSLMI